MTDKSDKSSLSTVVVLLVLLVLVAIVAIILAAKGCPPIPVPADQAVPQELPLEPAPAPAPSPAMDAEHPTVPDLNTPTPAKPLG